MSNTTAIQPPIQNVQPSKNLNQAISNASQRAIQTAIKKIVFSLANVYKAILQHLYKIIGITLQGDETITWEQIKSQMANNKEMSINFIKTINHFLKDPKFQALMKELAESLDNEAIRPLLASYGKALEVTEGRLDSAMQKVQDKINQGIVQGIASGQQALIKGVQTIPVAGSVISGVAGVGAAIDTLVKTVDAATRTLLGAAHDTLEIVDKINRGADRPMEAVSKLINFSRKVKGMYDYTKWWIDNTNTDNGYPIPPPRTNQELFDHTQTQPTTPTTTHTTGGSSKKSRKRRRKKKKSTRKKKLKKKH